MEVDESDNHVKKKIREAQLDQHNFILVVGEKGALRESWRGVCRVCFRAFSCLFPLRVLEARLGRAYNLTTFLRVEEGLSERERL